MLFEINNSVLIISEYALMIEPFKTIWEFDDTPKKENAIRLFMYVQLVCSPSKRNPFHGYSEADRPAKVKRELYKDPNHPTTDFMMQGVMKYKELLEHSSPSYSLLNAGLTAADQLRNYLETFDFKERTPGGAMVIKPKDITSALKELPDIAKGIESLIEKIQHELLEDSKTRNQREIGQYER